MKKIFNIFSVISLIAMMVFTACDPLEDVYDELDAVDTGIEKAIEVSLSSDDYETIADALRELGTAEDSANADFIEANQYFTDEIMGADNVPYYLMETYGSYGLNSSAEVTFNYNGEVPADLAVYTEAEEYELSNADYNLGGFEIGATKYFFPSKPASLYLVDILNQTITTAQDGDIMLMTYMESDVKPTIDTTETQDIAIYTESFPNEDDLGTFTSININGEQDWEWASYGDGCAKMSGYGGEALDNQNLLVSANISLADVEEVKLNFNHAINYMGDEYWDQLSVLITDDYNEATPIDSPWDELTIPNWTTGASWSFENSGDIDLTAYAGENIRIAFLYTSSTENAATWEIGDVFVEMPGSASVIGADPSEVSVFYAFDGSTWEAVEDVYYLTGADYDAMGAPGNYDNFSSSELPSAYLPAFVEYMYPTLGNDYARTIIYKFYNGSGTVRLGTTFTKSDGEWESSYDYIAEETQRFLVAGSMGNWIFDPTVSFEMGSTDYAMVVEEVKSSLGSDYIDSYGTAEYYSGASSYYSNFDLRISKREEYDPTTFEGLSEDEATTIIISRLAEAMQYLLQNKYPDATPQVSGVDVHYFVTFESYNNDFSRSTWVADMQCITAGNVPQFELVDNTFTRDGEAVVVE